jgi:intracellular multiplication protein IcmM
MAREAWNVIKHTKEFHVSWYRTGVQLLVISMCLNLVLILLCVYFATRDLKQDYYASDGIRFPIELNPLKKPNETSQYLLPPDPVSEDESLKVIPE